MTELHHVSAKVASSPKTISPRFITFSIAFLIHSRKTLTYSSWFMIGYREKRTEYCTSAWLPVWAGWQNFSHPCRDTFNFVFSHRHWKIPTSVMKKQSKSSMILWFPDSYVCPAAYVILFVKNQIQDAHCISINKLTPGRQDSICCLV